MADRHSFEDLTETQNAVVKNDNKDVKPYLNILREEQKLPGSPVEWHERGTAETESQQDNIKGQKKLEDSQKQSETLNDPVEVQKNHGSKQSSGDFSQELISKVRKTGKDVEYDHEYKNNDVDYDYGSSSTDTLSDAGKKTGTSKNTVKSLVALGNSEGQAHGRIHEIDSVAKAHEQITVEESGGKIASSDGDEHCHCEKCSTYQQKINELEAQLLATQEAVEHLQSAGSSPTSIHFLKEELEQLRNEIVYLRKQRAQDEAERDVIVKEYEKLRDDFNTVKESERKAKAANVRLSLSLEEEKQIAENRGKKLAQEEIQKLKTHIAQEGKALSMQQQFEIIAAEEEAAAATKLAHTEIEEISQVTGTTVKTSTTFGGTATAAIIGAYAASAASKIKYNPFASDELDPKQAMEEQVESPTVTELRRSVLVNKGISKNSHKLTSPDTGVQTQPLYETLNIKSVNITPPKQSMTKNSVSAIGLASPSRSHATGSASPSHETLLGTKNSKKSFLDKYFSKRKFSICGRLI